MPRIRNVKPEFFRHEGLQDLESEHPKSYVMLVFAGLWTQSDRNGNFRWRPKQCKLDILPFLKFDMDHTMSILEKHGYIRRYEHDGEVYGHIPAFEKHQIISKSERTAKHTYPEPSQDCFVTVTKNKDIGHRTYDIGHEDISTEPEQSPAPCRKVIGSLPTNKGTEYLIFEDQVEEFAALYPSVDIVQEFRNMKGWLIANKTRRKTERGMMRFVNSWLSRKQDRPSADPQKTITPAGRDTRNG